MIRRLDRLECARGLSALSIVLYHASSVVNYSEYFHTLVFGGFFGLHAFGDMGVLFFFVLSGFILCHVHRADFDEPSQLGRYAAKRFFRIYPPYWAVTLLVLPVYLWKGASDSGSLTVWKVLSSVMLWPHPDAPIVPVAWSLRHEVMFYAIFGLFLWRTKAALWVFGAWQAAILGAAILGSPGHYALQQLLDIRNANFLLGLGVAWWSGRGLTAWAGLGTWLGLAGFMFMAATGHFGWFSLSRNEYMLTMGISAALVVLGLAHADQREVQSRPWSGLLLLGEASYSIYLTHYALLSALAKVGRAVSLDLWLSPSVIFLLLAATATGLGIGFHLIVEKPLLRICVRCFVPSRSAPLKPCNQPLP